MLNVSVKRRVASLFSVRPIRVLVTLTLAAFLVAAAWSLSLVANGGPVFTSEASSCQEEFKSLLGLSANQSLQGGSLAKAAGALGIKVDIADDVDPENSLQQNATKGGAWKQRSFEVHGTYGFVKYAGYRIGPHDFVAIGLGALFLSRRKIGQCHWDALDGSMVNGTTEVIYGSEHHDLQYHVLIFKCRLWDRAKVMVGGTLTMSIDDENVVVYHEDPGEVPEAMPRRPFKHNITHCSPPLHDNIKADRIKIWLDYHMQMGIDHFVMYDVGAIDQEMLRMLQPYIDIGTVEITPFHDVILFPNWYFGQVLIINECLYRHRFTSQWVAFLDYDEYLWINNHVKLKDILSEHFLQAYVQHGCKLWKTEYCLPARANDPRWIMERMVFHRPVSFCRDKKYDPKLCPNYYGHRKYFANPRRVTLVENHQVIIPEQPGVSLSTDVMLHQHIRGLVTHGWPECNNIHNATDWLDNLVSETFLAATLRRLREKPIDLGHYARIRQEWEEEIKTLQNHTWRPFQPRPDGAVSKT